MGTGIPRIEGGYVGIDARELVGAWRACLDGKPGIGGFRAWLAAREMVARRQGPGRGRSPQYDVAELAALLGVSTRTATASIRRLVKADLMSWSEDAIGFPPLLNQAVEHLDDTIGRGRGIVALPRRMLRFLSRGARPAIIAVALTSTLRCLSRRRAGFEARGRFKSSWVARVFGVAERHARSARAELVRLEWLQPEDGDQWAWNRWGRVFRVRLDWRAPGADRPTLPAESDRRSSYPDLHPKPLREREHPDPVEPGPTGASLAWEGGEIPPQAPSPPTPPTTDLRAATGPDPAIPAPDLRDIRPEDLADTARTLDLHRQAVARGVMSASEADRVRFVAAVEHARAVGKSNPPGLLARIVRDGLWRVVTLADEDRARRRLRDRDRPAMVPAQPPRPASSRPPLPSPYGAEVREPSPTALADLLARLASGPRSTRRSG